MKNHIKDLLLIGLGLGLILIIWALTDLTSITMVLIFIGIVTIICINSKIKNLEEKFDIQQNKPVKNTKKYSYKLNIRIEPDWVNLYKEVSEAKSEKEWLKEIKNKAKKLKDPRNYLIGRRYLFTEYYDAETGLTTKLQHILFNYGKETLETVEEFGDSGYFYECDSDISLTFKENGKQREDRNKLSIEIGESFIRNDIFDKHMGGKKSDYDYEDKNYLFQFPLNDVFNFLYGLGQLLPGYERNTIVKWPEHIERKFKEMDIKYEVHKDREIELVNFEAETGGKEFLKKWNNPKVSVNGPSRWEWSSLESKNGTHYSISLKIFRPGENERIPEKN